MAAKDTTVTNKTEDVAEKITDVWTEEQGKTPEPLPTDQTIRLFNRELAERVLILEERVDALELKFP